MSVEGDTAISQWVRTKKKREKENKQKGKKKKIIRNIKKHRTINYVYQIFKINIYMYIYIYIYIKYINIIKKMHKPSATE